MLESLSRALSSLTNHARIVLLVGVSATPALAISVYHGLEERRLAIAHARDDLARTARIAAAQQEQLLAGVRQLLRALASGIARELARDPDACRAFFKRLVAESEGLYHTMGVLSAEGEMLCNALPWESRVEASDRRYFTLALETRTFAVGTYQIGRVTRRPAVDFGHPFSDGSDSLGGVVFAELDLERLNDQFQAIPLAPGTRLTLLDSAGTILARLPQAIGRIGEPARNESVRAAFLAATPRLFAAKDSDGVERLFAYEPVGRNADGHPAFHLVLSIPRAVAVAEADSRLLRTVGGILAATVILLLAAWYGAEVLVLRRIRALLEMTRRVRAGELGARTRDCGAIASPSSAEELAQLGLALDEMAETLQDRNERLQQAIAELKQEATTDPLTGLYNRRYLWDFLRRELIRARRSGAPVALIALDLDRFKQVNDTYGHGAGDLVLKRAAEAILSNIRGSDIACRYGGEEILVVLPEAGLEIAHSRAEAIRAGLERARFEHEGRRFGPVTASFGIAVYPEHGSDAEALVQAADRALYEAKRGGRNRVAVARAALLPAPPAASRG